jgi:hypothetical protein
MMARMKTATGAHDVKTRTETQKRSSRSAPPVDPRSYVVRVYRDCGEEMGEFAGMVELVESGKKKPFRSGEELMRLLRRSTALI